MSWRATLGVVSGAEAYPQNAHNPQNTPTDANSADSADIAYSPAACEIPAFEVATLYAQALGQVIGEAGLSGDPARGRARAMVAATLRNDPRLTPDQPNPRRCLVCNGRDGPSRPLVPILTPKPDFYLWLHAGDCHAAHRKSQSAKVAALLASIGG